MSLARSIEAVCLFRLTKVAATILATASLCFCFAQDRPTNSKPSENREDQLRQSGLAALGRETVRQKAGFCGSAQTTSAMNECFGNELVVTNRNYAAYVQSLAALLQIDPGWRLTGVSHGFHEFELAEIAWKTYRRKTCEAIENSDDGGSGGPTDRLTCELSVTEGHMQELASTYHAVWRR